MQPMTLGQLAEHVGGTVIGDPGLLIHAANTLEKAGAGEISFLANPKYRKQLCSTQAGAVVVKEEVNASRALLVVGDPYYAFTQIVILMYGHRRHRQTGISAKASIDASATIGAGTHIHDFAVVANDAVIGKNCILYPNVVVYDGCRIGNRVIVHANATLAVDGFGFATHRGKHHKIPHIGGVVIEDDVEIGAGAAIERGAFSDTVVGEGTKIGDAVVVGHGTVIGPHCLFVPQVGIAGSTTIGRHCVAAGQVGIGGHLKIGNQVTMAAQAGVLSDQPDNSVVFGTPAFNFAEAKRAMLSIRSLPELMKRVKELERRLAAKDEE